MRIGILSFAHLHAEGFQAGLRSIPGVELVGFSHEVGEEGRRYAAQFDLRWFPRHRDLLAEGLDGVLVCSENSRHLELVQMAAEAGLPILCEKPIEATLEAARAIRSACQNNGVQFMTAFPMRFAPSTVALRKAIQGGQLGKIYGVNGVNHSEMPDHHRTWFADKALAGGGAAMDHIVHLADLLRWQFDAEVVEVYAELDNLFYPQQVDVDTAGLLLVKLSNGVQASIDCSWSRPKWYARWGHLKMEVVGERGLSVLDSFAQHVHLYSRSSRPYSWAGFAPDSGRAMLEEFIGSIREKRPPCVGWNDGYQALRVVAAAYESAASHQPVALGIEG